MNLGAKELKNLKVFLKGHKELSAYYGIHPRTLLKWHAKLPIPWEKAGPKKNSSVRLHILVADAYYKIIKS